MSYSLYFLRRGPHLQKAVLQRYFREASRWFQVERADDGGLSVTYTNYTTGVYCRFDCDEPGEPLSDPTAPDSAGLPARQSRPEWVGCHHTGICFTLNYGRPTFFALEAMELVEDFTRFFDLLIINPQDDRPEPAPRPYDRDWLVRTWQRGNAWANRIAPKPYLPIHRSTTFWLYWREKPSLEGRFFDEAFVPDLYVFHDNRSGALYTAVVWCGGGPQLLPPCDRVLIVRERSGLFGWKKETRFYWVDRDALVQALSPLLQPMDSSVPDLHMLLPGTQRQAGRLIAGLPRQNWEEPANLRLPPDAFVDVEDTA